MKEKGNATFPRFGEGWEESRPRRTADRGKNVTD